MRLEWAVFAVTALPGRKDVDQAHNPLLAENKLENQQKLLEKPANLMACCGHVPLARAMECAA